MIKVKILRNSEGNIAGYNVEGHSGYSRKGRDIVCAAVSILTQNSLIALHEVCGVDEENIKYYIDDKKGILKVLLQGNLNEVQRNNVYIVLSTMELGIKNLMESYPENVRLEDEEV